MRLLFKGSKYLQLYQPLQDIKGNDVSVKAGEAVDVSEANGSALLRDFPGMFVDAKDVTRPKVDKQIKTAPVRK